VRTMIDIEPIIRVGIADRRLEIKGRLNGPFTCNGRTIPAGEFIAHANRSTVVLTDAEGKEHAVSDDITLAPSAGSNFTIADVTIGIQFHWERPEDQQFTGSLHLVGRDDGTVTAINHVPAEVYLRSVISSEMSAQAPTEFLKTHAILSRSWLLSALEGKGKPRESSPAPNPVGGEIIRWYDRKDHDIFDVCSDDHCQRYHGVTKITSGEVMRAVEVTRGMVLTYAGEICDARYSKACGGLTEIFSTAWDDADIGYLRSIADSAIDLAAPSSEEEVRKYILSSPDAYCNVQSPELLTRVLPQFDQETTAFFRWTVEYTASELSDLLQEKSGIDFGDIVDLVPLNRGPSGRIFRLKIVGSKAVVIVGKELEIRKWLSKSHLYSSAFVVRTDSDNAGRVSKFILHGAGWGHGVGLCQIGAAAMADQGTSFEDILLHYFRGAHITKIYD
jgi:stage II sporulation protein D